MSAPLPEPTVIFVNLPPKTFVGINLAAFNSSPNFHGITGLSSGLHFIYTGADASLSIRNGQWLQISRPDQVVQLHVLKWNPTLENLEVIAPESEVFKQTSASLGSLRNHGLVDYSALISATSKLQKEQNQTADTEDEQTDIKQHNLWAELVSHISNRLLNRILSNAKEEANDSVSESVWTLSSISSAPSDTEHIPGLSQQEVHNTLSSTVLYLIPINIKQTWPESAIGRERTEKARDRSWYLKHLIDWLSAGTSGSSEVDNQIAAREILGELQFCFNMVLTLANYSCLEQWKRILNVLLTCENALNEVEEYFVQATIVLRAQLNRVDDVDGGLFELGDEQNSAWLRKLIRTFRRNVDEAFEGKSSKLGTELTELETFLRDKYGWEDEKNVLRRGMIQLEDGEMVEMQMTSMDEEEETGEYAPTIVEQ